MITRVCVATLALLVSSATTAFTLQVTDGEGQPLSGVVVMLPGYAPAEAGSATMVQRNRAFDPHVLVVGQNTAVSFPNEDNTLHHVYSFSAAKIFSIELYEGIPEAPVLFDNLGIVELGCNIHDQMQAFIVVTDTAGVLQSDSNGQVSLPADASTKSLHLWHPRMRDNRHWQVIGPISSGQTVVLDTEARRQVTPHRLDRLQRRIRDL